jgi:hypothetical protein
VIDMVWPETGKQEAWLSDFTPKAAAQGDLLSEDFAVIFLLDPATLQ